MENQMPEAHLRPLEDHETDLVTGGTVKEGLTLVLVASVIAPVYASSFALGVAIGIATGAK
jgi:hypothetical protein